MSASESEPMSQSEQASDEESGDEDDDTQASGDSESEDEESDEEEVLEPKVLPQRGTRGNRMNTLIADEDSADEEFWQQEFFAEEKKDEEYKKSSEEEDEADTDFSESESESDEDSEDQREPVRASRHKALKPPGTKKPTTRVKQPLSPEAKALQAELKAEKLAQQALPGEAPTLRHSTRVRVEEAQQVRQRAEKVKPKRIRPQVEQRPLTQDELLAEAARTELDNLRDLEQMVALEEATKKKAMYKRSKYSGPMTRFHSKAVDNAALTMVEVVNMLPPPHMLPMKAPKPAQKLLCVITGQVARYRDPGSGYGYADLKAYKELKQRLQNEKRGILTGKRRQRQQHQAVSMVPAAPELRADTHASHNINSGAVQCSQGPSQSQQTEPGPTAKTSVSAAPLVPATVQAASASTSNLSQDHAGSQATLVNTRMAAVPSPDNPNPMPAVQVSTASAAASAAPVILHHLTTAGQTEASATNIDGVRPPGAAEHAAAEPPNTQAPTCHAITGKPATGAAEPASAGTMAQRADPSAVGTLTNGLASAGVTDPPATTDAARNDAPAALGSGLQPMEI